MKTMLRILMASALILSSSSALLAEGYNETTKWWFLNSLSPNWTCSDTRAPCYADATNKYTMTGMHVVRNAGTLYAYLDGAGSPGPCKQPLGGDNFCVFTTTDTAPGWTGSGLVLRNHWPRPDDGWFWVLRSAFYDSDFGKFRLISARTATGTTETIDVVDAKLGTSTDGINFTWSTLITAQRSQIGLRPDGFVLVRHPTQPKVWVGTLGLFYDNGAQYTTPWKVDWSANPAQVHIKNSTGVWQQIPVGGTLTFQPYIEWWGGGSSIATVNVGGVSRLEVWGSRVLSYTTGSGVQNNPCSPGYPNGVATTLYLANRSVNSSQGDQQAGSATVFYRVFDPNSLTFTTGEIDATSAVRALPSDYRWAVGYGVSRLDTGGREYVYSGGSKDNVICTHNLTWNPWAGTGIYVTKADFIP